MPIKDVNDYLQQNIRGKPELLSGEKKEYLGIFRERIFLVMTGKDMQNKVYQMFLKQQLKDKPGGKIKISVHIDSPVRMAYILIAQDLNIPFTVVDTDHKNGAASIGLVYHFDTVVDEPVINIDKKYQQMKK
ncbi:DUF1694 domain-containing protein [Vagococcus elongatus]|uniref:DUF1694 domain-containing protein n=1 Tax=Vagococcus elongatus TaxID=180344 RepID=A0A430ARM6_9ENTE|nr:DUF1694 domain-containing protein [Vagococcus elongatus]RSU10704.1 hypothetical protein CBF29_08950 [Vagococcus elongatus]